MKKNFILLTLALCMLSCNDDNLNRDMYSYTFTEKSDLTISTPDDSYMKFGTIEAGENLVFEYHFTAQDDVQIADDEYGETIKFEIDNSLNEFSYSNTELSTIDIVFSKHCFCYFPMDASKDVEPIGIISGKKISENTWKIKIDVTFYGEEIRTIEGSFTLK